MPVPAIAQALDPPRGTTRSAAAPDREKREVEHMVGLQRGTTRSAAAPDRNVSQAGGLRLELETPAES
jgi:hypothetical protein